MKSTSTLKIVAKHTFTLFNLVNLILALMVTFVGSYKNMLFIFIAVINTLISIINDLRAKKIVDKLKLISEKRPTIEKDGKTFEIAPENVQKGDLLILKLGDQVLFDSEIEEGTVEVNEANITGEADNITKEPGEKLISGSFVVSGLCKAKVEAIGEENSLNKLEKSAHEIKTANSKLFTLMNNIVKYISYALIPVGALLLWARFRVPETTTEIAVTSTVAALINMIPEGLILLTSSVLALATIRLAKKKVLVQDLYSIETLARVDCICLDKTGTLTTGKMTVENLIPAKNRTEPELTSALRLILGYLPADNATSVALHHFMSHIKKDAVVFGGQAYSLERSAEPRPGAYVLIPFSSDRKFSGIKNETEEYLLGAAEFITKDEEILKEVKSLSPAGFRTLAVIKRTHSSKKDLLLGLIILKDELRADAPEIINYFYENDVDIKVISGDNLETVASVAEAVGIKKPQGINLSEVSRPNYSALVKTYNLFTRVKPNQKKELIKALKKQGKTVAMTGDGVNDILAMKEADCSIAIGEGSDAARRSAKIVLINSGFEAVPSIIAEGRQSINNLERSTSLFLAKTIYASILAVLFVFLPFEYPFSPIEMSLLNFLCIGFPGLVLALEPNTARIKNQFINNIKHFSVPAGLAVAVAALALSIFAHLYHFPRALLTTLSAFAVFIIGILLIYRISHPLNTFRSALILSIIAAFVLVFLTPLGVLVFDFVALF